jgi:hypothetical protein
MKARFITAITQAEVLYGIGLLPKGKRRDRIAHAAKAMFAEDFRPFRFPISTFPSLMPMHQRRFGFDETRRATSRVEGLFRAGDRAAKRRGVRRRHRRVAQETGLGPSSSTSGSRGGAVRLMKQKSVVIKRQVLCASGTHLFRSSSSTVKMNAKNTTQTMQE